MIWSIQARNMVTRAYTPGVDTLQNPLPQDTIPTRVQAPDFSQTRGPPESPWKRTKRQLARNKDSDLQSQFSGEHTSAWNLPCMRRLQRLQHRSWDLWSYCPSTDGTSHWSAGGGQPAAREMGCRELQHTNTSKLHSNPTPWLTRNCEP